MYDDSGSPIGFTYNGTTYYYRKNLGGDVTGIVNASGTVVVSYTYDAWGNPVSITGSMTSTLGEINPIRYRGYYYDTETGFYYLQSRYYDPVVGRFISPDSTDFLGITGTTLSLNLFAYCENNAVNNVDYEGNAPFLGWGIQLEGSFMGFSGGIELVWYKNISKSMYGNRNLPCIYLYGGLSYNFKGENVWNIKSLINYVKDSALRAFGSTRKSAWKIGGGLSLCAFLVYGTINSPQRYTGPFITTGGTLFHVKGYYSRSPKGDVYCFGLGVSSSKFGFSPMSGSAYTMIPGEVVISIANMFTSLFNTVKRITNLI